MNGDTARARKLIEEAIAISRRSGDKFGLAASLGRLGDIARSRPLPDRFTLIDRRGIGDLP